MRITGSIIKPALTEKALALAQTGKYTFFVSQDSRAGLIKKEIKKMYGVDVVAVRSIVLPGKKRRQGRTARFAKTAQRKKMIVTLKAGQKIELLAKESK